MRKDKQAVEMDGPAAQQAYRRLMEMLMNGELPFGEPIREAALSQRLGLNRGAIREALNQLVAQDILTYTPYCGYRFAEFTLRDTVEWYRFRMAIEPAALEQAFQPPYHMRLCDELKRILDGEQQGIETNDQVLRTHCDISFHLRIVEASQNRLMIGAYMRASLPFIAAMAQLQPTFSEESPTEADHRHTHLRHVQLLDEIRDGEPERAVELLRRHLSYSCKNLNDAIVRRALDQCPVNGRLNADGIGSVINTLLAKA